MIPTIILAVICIILFISSIFFFPYIKIKKMQIPTYIVICSLTAIIYLIFGAVSIKDAINNLTAKTAINPIKILVLFFSMTFLSTYLDELGLFSYLANLVCKKFKNKYMIFTMLFVVISILTIFTSNDIIILTLTPFICYFAKRSKINPLPYLLMEFFAANTLSMALIIGNPTNIYLGFNFNIDFFSYLSKMLLPSIVCAIVLFLILSVIFHNDLKGEIICDELDVKIEDKVLIIVGILFLLITIIGIALANYINIEAYLMALGCAIGLIITTIIINLIRRKSLKIIIGTLKRLPYALIFFLISMFIIVIALDNKGVLKIIGEHLPKNVFLYGLLADVCSNLVNNIPMSVLFTNVLKYSDFNINLVYASIVGSNLGAFMTPVGALAGIMWMNILKSHDVDFSYKKFILYGMPLSLILTAIALLFLM